MAGTVQCPVCDTYAGKPESVRAHISAKQDEAHQGLSGFDYETELGLEDSAEPETEPDNQEPVEVPSQESNDESPVEVREVEADQDSDGTPLVKIVLAGAGAEAVSQLLTGNSLVENLNQNPGPNNRRRF